MFVLWTFTYKLRSFLRQLTALFDLIEGTQDHLKLCDLHVNWHTTKYPHLLRHTYCRTSWCSNTGCIKTSAFCQLCLHLSFLPAILTVCGFCRLCLQCKASGDYAFSEWLLSTLLTVSCFCRLCLLTGCGRFRLIMVNGCSDHAYKVYVDLSCANSVWFLTAVFKVRSCCRLCYQ